MPTTTAASSPNPPTESATPTVRGFRPFDLIWARPTASGFAPPIRNDRHAWTNNATSYVPNEYVVVDRLDGFGRQVESFRNLNALRNPTETITVFEISDVPDASIFADHTHSRNWHKGWETVLQDIQPDRHRTGGPNADHTKGSANYLYASGHVLPLNAKPLKERVGRGENIARPPE